MKDLWGSSRSESVEFEAMMEFFQTTTPNQVLQLEDACKNNNWDGFRDLIMKIGVPNDTESNLPPPTIDDPPN